MTDGATQETTSAAAAIDLRLGRRFLVVVGEGLAVTRALPDNGRIEIGRDHRCDVVIDHKSVSRRHAILELGTTVSIEDLGSSNGTKVGGRRIEAHRSVEVPVNEPVDIGSILVIVREHRTRTVSSSPARGADDVMEHLHRLADRLARSTISVLIGGETGVGKELMARRIHAHSPRAAGPFLGINCATLSETLFESELFGHEKGAFTGALRVKPGLLEVAQGGTVFLDEVGELRPASQVKLLRVIEERLVLRVGGVVPRAIDVRFVAATNRDLEAEVATGQFRQDLFFRLNGVTIDVPPLRRRLGELPALVELFIAESAERLGVAAPALSCDALDWMLRYPWPGNIRELRHVIERAVLLSAGAEIRASHLPTEKSPRCIPVAAPRTEPIDPVTRPNGSPLPRHRATRDMAAGTIAEALARCGGNQKQAAKLLGISRRSLINRLNELDLPRPRKIR